MDPSQHDQSLNMIEVAITVERPTSEDLAQYDRGEKYEILRESATEQRERLANWIKEQGLSEEVVQIDEPTVFNMLFAVCTPKAAEQLKQAPGVISVVPSKDFKVDLL